jgi:hypothetical protein
MDNVQNCDSYINIPSSQTYRFNFFPLSDLPLPIFSDTKAQSALLFRAELDQYLWLNNIFKNSDPRSHEDFETHFT